MRRGEESGRIEMKEYNTRSGGGSRLFLIKQR